MFIALVKYDLSLKYDHPNYRQNVLVAKHAIGWITYRRDSGNIWIDVYSPHGELIGSDTASVLTGDDRADAQHWMRTNRLDQNR
jgi:hypothetical protein